jgi:iron complex outermembrane recepter protein
MTNKLILSSSAAVLALVIAMPATVFAQAATPVVEDRTKVETIIVTARKTSEALISAPVAVTAVGAADINRLNVQSIDDLARFTPGLSFSKAFGRATDRPVIRGAASILAGTQPGVEAGAAYFVDGVYYQGDISSIDMTEVQRVEVIKGPQSALYGRNTYSGAIDFVTRSPGSAFRAGATVSVADHGEQSLNLNIGGPITDRLSGSLSARAYVYDGEFKNSSATNELLGEEKTQSITGVLEFRPIDSLTLRARLVAAKDEDGPRAFGFQSSSQNNCFPGYRSNAYRGAAATTNNNPNQWFCGVIKDAGVYNQNTGAAGSTFAAAAPFLGVERDLFFGSLIADVDLPNAMSARVLFGFRNERLKTGSDSDFQNGASAGAPQGSNLASPISNSLFGSSGFVDSDDYSLEAKLISDPSKRLRWLVGVYGYQLSQNNYDINFSFAAPGIAPFVAETLTQRSGTNVTSNSAIFARVSYDITDTLSFDLEGRQQTEQRVTRNYCAAIRSIFAPTVTPTCASGFVAGTAVSNVAVGGFTYNDSRSFDSFTPRATLSWKPNEDLTIYGIYSQGTKPGGLNGSLGLQNGFPTFEPEESTNYELGAKARIFNGRGTVTVSAYNTQANEMQLTTAVAGSSGVLTSIVTNQGNAEIKGLEGEFRFRVTENLGIGFTASHVSAQFKEGCDEFQYTLESGGFLIGNSCETTRRVTPVTVAQPNGTFIPTPGASGSIAGEKVPLVPETQYSFNIDYSRPLGSNGLEAFASADVSYESTKYVQVHGGAETGDTTLVGGRFGVRNANWKLSIWGKNLTEEDSIPIATRWFDLLQGASASVGLSCPQSGCLPTSTGFGVDTGSPRAFFYMPRRGRTIGAELKWTY